MKKILSIFYAIAFSLVFFGCMTSTGFIQVDRVTAKQNGIKITHVEDNAFFTIIEYDYSAIPNFTTNGISVMLIHNFYAESQFDYLLPYSEDLVDAIQKVDYRSPYGIYMYNMMHMYTVEGVNITKLPNRPAIVLENEPGRLKILSFDDIGTYQIKYDPTATAAAN